MQNIVSQQVLDDHLITNYVWVAGWRQEQTHIVSIIETPRRRSLSLCDHKPYRRTMWWNNIVSTLCTFYSRYYRMYDISIYIDIYIVNIIYDFLFSIRRRSAFIDLRQVPTDWPPVRLRLPHWAGHVEHTPASVGRASIRYDIRKDSTVRQWKWFTRSIGTT